MAETDSFDEPERKALPRRKKKSGAMGAVVIALLLLLVGAGALYFLYSQGALDEVLGIQDPEAAAEAGAVAADEEIAFTDTVFDFPIFIVTLIDDSGRRLQLLVEMRFVLGSPLDIPVIQERRPTIEDLFTLYLREIRVDDIRDASQMDLLRQVILDDLNRRISDTGVVVRDLLFLDFAMQE